MGESPGRRGQGRVYKGPPIPRASLPKGVPSIPTKYETIVTQPIKEKDGFGTSTQRFTFSENAQPGPGSYHQQLAWVNDSGSMSKKGMGSGFVSKHQRFTFKPSYTGPGPGQYNSHVRPEETKLKFNHATTSAAFAAARSEGLGPPLPVKASRTGSAPAPNTYLPSAKRDGGKVSLGSGSASVSAFKTTTRQQRERAMEEPKQDFPGPGSHDLAKSWEVQESGATAFRHATGRTGRDGSLRARPPPAMVYGDAEAAGAAGPGPGAYENHIIHTIERKQHKIATGAGRMETPAFTPTETDRFGQPFVPKVARPQVPGPGNYDGVSAPLFGERPYGSHLPTPASAFTSTTDRAPAMGPGRAAVPGPAYYKPASQPKKRTFHLNTRQQWVSN
eukprot:jgi/Tetstr1/444802/TSEL_032650.t1